MSPPVKPARCACGGESFTNSNITEDSFFQACSGCPAATCYYPTEAEAIAAWNLSCAAGKLLKALKGGPQAIRDACHACDGTGALGPDEECEYCGRPMADLRRYARAALALAGGQEDGDA